MSKSRTSLFIIGILIAMLAASLLTVLGLYLAGAIKVNPVELEFTVKAVDPKEYDGTPLRARNYSLDSGELKDGHTLVVSMYGEQTECGTSESDLRVTVLDKKENDVTKDYAITIHNAELKVVKRPLTIILSAQQIPYSGSQIFIEDYELYKGTTSSVIDENSEKGELATGHKLVVSFPGKFENVGDEFPSVEEWRDENFMIYDAAGRDVTSNYDLAEGIGGGTIEIVPRKLSVRALDIEKYYDGTPVTGKYELVGGALVAGHFIGAAQFTDSAGRPVSVRKAGESARVKVSSVTIYEQVGFDLVPLDEELQKNYELEISNELYGTLSVKKRPVTVRVKDLIKVYDGLPLDSVMTGDAYTTDLPDGFRISQYNSPAETLTDVYDGTYSIEITEIVSDDTFENVTDQFEVTCIPALARITPIRLRCGVRSFSEDYTGREISINTETAIRTELENVIDAYLNENDPDYELQMKFEQLKGLRSAEMLPYFRALTDRTVKNAGKYNYTMEFTDTGKELFGGDGNVIFTFNSAVLTVMQAHIDVAYYKGTAPATNLTKRYDGTEMNLDYRNLVVEDSENLTVTGANFRYVTDAEASAPYNGNHTRTGMYYVQVSSVKIYDSATLTDVSDNYVVAAPTLRVQINRATLTASARQTFIDYEVESIPTNTFDRSNLCTELEEIFRSSVVFEGLAAGDTVNYNVDNGFTFSASFTLNSSDTVIFQVSFENANIITNSEGMDVRSCYDFVGEGEETIITVRLKEKTA